ncbi:MAG: M20/M25/M40 family metallo-hydrolase [Rhizobacter sp.]|nr:M20/M25/M40 family metallo-hydrolase [Ferruginibacter sp.]
MNNKDLTILSSNAVKLLQSLIAIPSPSKDEAHTAACIEQFLQPENIITNRAANNIWAINKFYDSNKPTILLNSHHDTVAANLKYTRDPFLPSIEEGKLYGLGSTDAGASLVCLVAAFLYYYEAMALPYNIVLAATAEEEISGKNGIEKLFGDKIFSSLFTHKDSFAIVGEPTELQLAVAEKGLLVLDCIAHGKAGHAAREEGENAVYKAMTAIEWFKNFRFQKISPALGEIKMSVTSVFTENKAHNVVPASCSFVVDIRVTDVYTHEEILEIIEQHIDVEVTARSTRLRSSSIDINHRVVKAGIALGKISYGSPTASDQALIPLPSLKCGPGFSGQSHSADEFVEVRWIAEGVEFYIEWLGKLMDVKRMDNEEMDNG